MAEQQRQGEQVIFIAPPTGGLNTFDNPLALSPQFASEYVNFMPPTGSGIVARPAIEEVLKLNGVGLALMSYTSSATIVPFSTGYFDIAETYPEISNLMVKMRLPDGTDALFETTPQSSPPTFKFIDNIINDSNNNDYILFLDALYISDGGNARPYIYVKGRKLVRMRWFAPVAKPDSAEDAGKWFVGDQITGCENLTIYKNRMMASQRNTLNIFYIPAVSANPLDPDHWDPTDVGKAFIVETTGVFTLLGVVSKGGYVLKMFTVASGKQGELADLFCVLTTKGELVVYSGSDPSNSSTWSLLGHYYIAIPLNKNCVCNVEGDVIIATINGFVSVKAILAGGQSQGPLSEALEKRISTLFSQFQFKVPTFVQFIFMQFHNKRKLLILNVPERMGIPLADVEVGYIFDQSTWLMFSNQLASSDLNNTVIGTLRNYIWAFCRDFKLTYYLNNSSNSRIELEITTSNLQGGGDPYILSCTTTIKMGIYTENPDTGVLNYLSVFNRDPVYQCNNIQTSSDTMPVITVVYPEWNKKFIQEPIELDSQSVTPIVCRIPPPRPGDKEYSWQVTDVNSSSSSFLFGILSNLYNIAMFSKVDMLKAATFKIGFDSTVWLDKSTPHPTLLDLRTGADLELAEINVTDMLFTSAQIDSWLAGGGTLALMLNTESPNILTVAIELNAAGNTGLLSIICRSVAFNQLFLYDKHKTAESPQWYDAQPLENGLVKRGFRVLESITYTGTGYGGGTTYHYGLKCLTDHIIVKSDRLKNPAVTFAQELQYNFFKYFLEPDIGPVKRPGVLYMPMRAMYGSGSLVSQLLSNLKHAYEVSGMDPNNSNSANSCYVLHNAFRLVNAQNEVEVDLPIDLRVIADWHQVSNNYDDNVTNFKIDMILYIGPYELSTPPLTPNVEDYTTFGATAPYYCCTYHYEFTRDLKIPAVNVYDYPMTPVPESETFKVIRDVKWESEAYTDLRVLNDLTMTLESASPILTNLPSTWTWMKSGIYEGSWATQPADMRLIWGNMFGWMYTIFVFRDVRGVVYAGVNDNTDVNRSMCPFVNFISTQQSYKSSQYVLDVQRGTWAQWKDINMITGIEHENEFYFIRNADADETLSNVLYEPLQTQLCRFNSDLDGDFGIKPIDAHYKTGFTDLGAPNLKKFTKCKIFGTASVFWGRYPYDLYYSIDFQDQDPVRYSGDTVEASLRKPKILQVKPKMSMKSQLNNVSYSEYAAQAKYLADYLATSSNVKWVNMMTVATQGTRIALGSRFAITEHNVIVWGYQIHYIPLSSY
jgi:hypothetical protein